MKALVLYFNNYEANFLKMIWCYFMSRNILYIYVHKIPATVCYLFKNHRKTNFRNNFANIDSQLFFYHWNNHPKWHIISNSYQLYIFVNSSPNIVFNTFVILISSLFIGLLKIAQPIYTIWIMKQKILDILFFLLF